MRSIADVTMKRKRWRPCLMLKDEDIDLVLENVDMYQIADHFAMHINRKGFTKCPFHNEKTASVKIYKGRRGYYCFGCGAGGDAINFVERYLNLQFEEAVRYIASAFHILIDGDFKMSDKDRMMLIERQSKREAKERAYFNNIKAMSLLSEKIRWYEYLVMNIKPYGELFCYLHNRIPILKGEWEKRFALFDK